MNGKSANSRSTVSTRTRTTAASKVKSQKEVPMNVTVDADIELNIQNIPFSQRDGYITFSGTFQLPAGSGPIGNINLNLEIDLMCVPGQDGQYVLSLKK